VDRESETLAAKRLLFLLLTLGGLGACSPARPDTPTFAADVRPIFVAHCTRCHGAGDMLQGDPTSTLVTYRNPPIQGYFQYYRDHGDCSEVDGGPPPMSPLCRRGAYFYAAINKLSWKNYVLDVPALMPPAPAAPLNDFERDIVLRWSMNPVCGSGPLCADDGGVD
jgi:hypothetical protein